jgi:hypothetical protein
MMATLETQYKNWLKKNEPITYSEWLEKFSEIHNLDKFNMKDLLIKLNACNEAKDWAADKSWKEIFETCHRGDWLLWLFQKTNPNDLQLLTLAKGHCANTVRHLMKDERSIKAVDVAIAFGEGKSSREELDSSASAAASASWSAAYAAAVCAYASASADAAAYAAAYAARVSYGDAAAASARKENQQLTADICRKYLPIEVWNI